MRKNKGIRARGKREKKKREIRRAWNIPIITGTSQDSLYHGHGQIRTGGGLSRTALSTMLAILLVSTLL